MGIVNLKTDLKSLKYGKDRIYMGDSGQPYVENPIPEKIKSNLANKDFLLRGGLKAPLDAIKDVKRLTKWFFDTKNPSGFLFIAKQNLLSRIAVRTQASGFIDVGVNEGLYTPLTTLGQAGLGFTGLHLPKQGIIPYVGVRIYGPKSNKNPTGISIVEKKVIGGELGEDNRLVQLTKWKINQNIPWDKNFRKNQIAKNEQNILSYSGGPGSILGIGRTRIRFATNNAGNTLGTGLNSPAYFIVKDSKKIPKGPTIKLRDEEGGGWLIKKPKLPKGLPMVNSSEELQRSFEFPFNNFLEKTYKQSGFAKIYDFRRKLLYKDTSTTETWETNQGIQSRVIPSEEVDVKVSTITGIAPNYSNQLNTIDGLTNSRINYVSPGQRGNIISYSLGKIDYDGRKIGPVDKINALPIYRSTSGKNPDKTDDLIPFRIASLSWEDNKIVKDYMHFRAYIKGFGDSYKAKWNPINYIGRGESFYKYDSFDRDISLSFIIAAQSREELLPQYNKLNYLVSNLAPTYSDAGYMGGSLVALTVGDWISEQIGFIPSISLDIKDSPWEIGLSDTYGIKGGGSTLPKLPHYITVKMGFTPIENFRVEKQKLEPSTSDGESSGSPYKDLQPKSGMGGRQIYINQ
jgi:hypothetical protein